MKAEAEEEEEEEEEGEEEEEEEEGSTLKMFNGIAKPTREPQYHSLFSFANREDRLGAGTLRGGGTGSFNLHFEARNIIVYSNNLPARPSAARAGSVAITSI